MARPTIRHCRTGLGLSTIIWREWNCRRRPTAGHSPSVVDGRSFQPL